LGGLGEIGLNMMVYRYGSDILVVDAGLMFPDEEMLGVDMVVPEIRYLRENRECLRGLILTHGHEDHVGAVPYILRELKGLPVYGTALTLGLIEGKLREHGLLDKVQLKVVSPRDKLRLGVFEVEFIRVSHSVVDGVGLALKTPLGVVIHTGDFKIDHTPIDGELMDLYTFAAYGEQGVLALFSDSTNAGRGGYTLSEKEVAQAFEKIFRTAERKIIVATFASNIHRIQQVVDTAVKFDRKVCLLGRSILDNCRIAMRLGRLHIPEGALVEVKDSPCYEDRKLVYITTGSQGEPMSALSRMAMNDHKQIKVRAGDTVVISAKAIPGNEKSIARLINHFFRRGARVVYEEVSEIHVSGHACQEELKLMLNLVRPRFFVPIHGEYHQLVQHKELALKLGYREEAVILAVDGDIVEFDGEQAMISGKVPAGRVLVDGKGVGDVGEVVLRDRQHLASDGILVVFISIDKQTGSVVSGPEIISRGFVHEDESQELLGRAKQVVAELLDGLGVELKTEWAVVKSRIRSALKRFIVQEMERKPMILPIIIEI